MKRFILGFILAISIPVMAAVLWPSGAYLETFQNGFIFGTGKVLSVLNDVITFDGKRLDDAPKDRVYFQDFEGASVSFTCDANLTKADDTATPLNGTASVTFTQGSTAPAANAKCTGPTITLPLKAQTKNLVEVCFQATYSGDDNDMAVNIESGGTDLVQVTVPASTTAEKHCGYFSTSSTTSVDLDIEVLTPNANAVLEIDDIQITVDPLQSTQIYASSKWEDCGLTASDFQGVGTPTAIDIDCKRDGEDLLMRGTFTTGTVSASEFRMNLGSGRIIGGITTARTPIGNPIRNASSNDAFHFLATKGNSYLNLGRMGITASFNQYSLANGNNFASTELITLDGVRIPIAGWSDTSQGVVVKGKISSDVSSTNVFSAKVAAGGTVSDENVDWIDGNCTSGSTPVCTFVAGLFSETPNCTITAFDVNTNNTNQISAQSASSITITKVADRAFNLTCQRSTDYVKESDRTIVLPEGLYAPTCYVYREESNGTDGGTASTSSWTKLVLNSTSGSCGFLSLSSSVLSIEAGSYNLDCSKSFYATGYTETRFRNTTSSTSIMGEATYCEPTGANVCFSDIKKSFSITSQSNFEFQYYVTSGASTENLGIGNSGSGESHIYGKCAITKIR